MGWRDRRMKRLLNRRAHGREVSEFMASVLLAPKASEEDQARARVRLDELDQESMYLEGAILRLQKIK
jgi:hypothetical protein